jgi:hypothetical protein
MWPAEGALSGGREALVGREFGPVLRVASFADGCVREWTEAKNDRVLGFQEKFPCRESERNG